MRGQVLKCVQVCMNRILMLSFATMNVTYTVNLEPLKPLPTNDAHMRHGLSISHKNLYGGFNTRHYTSVHGFCFF